MEEEFDIIEAIRERNKDIKLTRSDVVRTAIIEFGNKLPKGVFDEIRRKQLIKNRYKESRNFFRAMYLIRNFEMRIYSLTKSYFINNQNLEMGIVRETINHTLKIYACFDDEYKELLKGQVDGIKKWRNKSFITDKLDMLRQLELRK